MLLVTEVERVRVHTSAPNGVACSPLSRSLGGILRDSVCIATGSQGTAVVQDVSCPSTPHQTVPIRNVTAVATGASGVALEVKLMGCDIALEGRNVIAEGAGADLRVQTDSAPDTRAEIDLDHSAFDDAAEIAGTNAFATAPGSADNITSRPRFADPSSLDFHQRPASPTIDAGDPGASDLGALDIDREPRVIGTSVDIGADERDTVAPALRILGRRLRLKPNRVMRVRLRCPARETSPPCRGKLSVKTRKRVRFRGKAGKPVLALKRYRVGAGQTSRVKLKLAGPKARLVRNKPPARKVRAITRVRDGAGNSRRIAKPMLARPVR